MRPGDEGKIARYIKLAEIDWRDLVLIAEYGRGQVRQRDLSRPFEE